MLGQIIISAAAKYALDPHLVACIVLQESSGDPWAARYEDAFYNNYLQGKGRYELTGVTGAHLPTELRFRSISFGPMQVMGETGRSIGQFKGKYLTELCDPEVGVDVGCRVFRHYLSREGGDRRRALARYNAGKVSAKGLLYADEVLERLKNNQYLELLPPDQ